MRLGVWNRNAEELNSRQFEIIEKHIHPLYKDSFPHHDIALVRLDKKVQFSDYIRPACLVDTPDPPSKAIATGWGDTSFRGEDSDILMKVVLDHSNAQECDKKYLNRKFQARQLTVNETTQLCFGSNEGGKDTCQVGVLYNISLISYDFN